MASMKRLILNVSVFLGSAAVCLGFGELAIRGVYPLIRDYQMEMWRYFAEVKKLSPNPRQGFTHYPNRDGVYYGVEIATNNSGFRDREFPREKLSGVTRIMFLGDSFTLGWGVPFEQTFEKVLEKKLNTGGQRVETMNLGVGNYNTTMEVELFKSEGLPYRPDAVVLVYFVNDTEPVPQMSRWGYRLRRSSYLFAFLHDRMLRYKASWGFGEDWREYYASLYDATRPALAENAASFKELARVCREHGVKLFVVNYPDLHALKEYPFDVATQHIRTLAQGEQAPFLDLLPVLAPHAPESLWVSNEDTHGNAKAAALVAAAMDTWLRSLLPSLPQESPVTP